MSDGSFVTLDLAKVADPSAAAASAAEPYGRIVLNCGALPFVVLCLASPGA